MSDSNDARPKFNIQFPPGKHWVLINDTDEKSLIDVIDQEIKWCQENPSPQGKIYDEFFIAGLQQAKYLIEKVLKVWHKPR